MTVEARLLFQHFPKEFQIPLFHDSTSMIISAAPSLPDIGPGFTVA
jgi:hypothetical protein